MGQFSSSPSDEAKQLAEKVLETRRTYHGLARCLEGGTPTRPGLPVELVIHILRLAECTLPCLPLSMSSDTLCEVHAGHGHSSPSRTPWFSTPRIDPRILSRVAKMQLVTVSCDQGWCDNPAGGSWSWFEIVILASRDQDEPLLKKRDSDGSDLVWVSHRNPIASRDFSEIEGVMFGSDHEIWQHLAERDIIQVRVCAQFGGWSNRALKGFLKVDEWFEPTLPPRDC